MSKSGGKQRGHMLSYGHPHVATWSILMAASIRPTASSSQSNWFSPWGVSDASKTPVTETKGNVGESDRAADGVIGLREFTTTSNGSFGTLGRLVTQPLEKGYSSGPQHANGPDKSVLAEHEW
jgi:hypothetical protein